MSDQSESSTRTRGGEDLNKVTHETTKQASSNEHTEMEEPRNLLRIFFLHPVFVTLAAIASLISVPLSIHFYYAAQERPELTYYTHPIKATVVRSGEASRLTAIFDNKPVSTDITAAQVAIWNQGRKSIRKDQVLKPVVISTGNGSPILEATIRKTSRDVTQLSLGTDELQKGRLTVLWNILEQNDGGVIQLIYAGNTDVPIRIDGVVEGQRQIERLEFGGKIKTPYEQYETEKTDYKTAGFLLIMLAGLFFLIAFEFVGGLRRSTRSSIASLQSKDKDIVIDSYDESIKWYKEQINYYEDLDKQGEAKSVQYVREGKADLAKSYESVLAGYKNSIRSSTEAVEKYERMKEERIAIIRERIQTYQRRARRANVAFIVIVTLALLALITAVYILFIVRPIGPPFGF